jgi:hypothetical protein
MHRTKRFAKPVKVNAMETNCLLLVDKEGNILAPEDIDELPIWEIEERELHLYSYSLYEIIYPKY